MADQESVIVRRNRGTEASDYTAEVLVKKEDTITSGKIDQEHPDLRPGDKAFTADGSVLYVKDLDGTWKEFGG